MTPPAMARLTLLRPDDPPDGFPDPGSALSNPDGLLAIGGDLSPERLLAAYRRGIFPWFEQGQPILWWSPDPRAVLSPGTIHVSRSLKRTLRRDLYTVSVDQDFTGVITACAETRAGTGTWITPEMIRAYTELHRLGFAHSVETWSGGELAGGIYGVALGGAFFGESMFSTRADASKVALVALGELLEDRGVELIDCQVASDHLSRLGARLMERGAFLDRLEALVDRPMDRDWARASRPTATLRRAASLRPAG
jgi:leucyl/phenylalanyl-tRNA--protein transferase